MDSNRKDPPCCVSRDTLKKINTFWRFLTNTCAKANRPSPRNWIKGYLVQEMLLWINLIRELPVVKTCLAVCSCLESWFWAHNMYCSPRCDLYASQRKPRDVRSDSISIAAGYKKPVIQIAWATLIENNIIVKFTSWEYQRRKPPGRQNSTSQSNTRDVVMGDV